MIRTVEGGGLRQFISVFVDAPNARPLVKAVRSLSLPPGTPSDAAAVEIETVAGTDVLVSILTPAPVKLSTSAGALATDNRLAGQTLFVEDSEMRRAHPILLAKPDGSRTRIYTKRNGVGFEARTGDTWEFIPTASWQRP